MDPFVLQLAELCREHPAQTKWVIVPSHRLGHTLGERLVLEGTNWANLRFVTPQDLALETGGPFLFERGIEPLAEELGPPLILRLLLELPASVPSYFRNLAEQPSMATLLWVSVRELRMNGLIAAGLASAAFSNESKQAELSALEIAYEQHLSTNKQADEADVYREALLHLQFCPVKPNDLLSETPGFIWSTLERRFLDALLGQRLLSKSYDIPAVDRSARLQSLGSRTAWVSIPTQPKTDSERLSNLTTPINLDSPQADGTLTLFHAAGKEAEVEEVVRRVLAAGMPFDQVEVACARPSEYGLLFWEKAERHGWPTTLEMGIPVTVTRPARALLAFCDWITAGFPCSGLQRLLRSGTIRLDLGDGPSVGQASRLLAQSTATWGRDTYKLALSAQAESFRMRASDVSLDEDRRSTYLQRADQAERLGQWIEEMLQQVPQADKQSQIPLSGIIACLTTFLTNHAKTSSALDGAASAALIANLERLSVLSDLRRSLSEGLALVRTSITGAVVEADRARPGHLYISSLGNAGFSGRPTIFVVGLEEGGVFPALLEDPVLLDDERTTLAPNILPTSQDRVTEAVFRVVSRLACLGGKVCLSYSCRDLNENRPTFPSWIVLQAFRVLRGKTDLTFEDLNLALGPPATSVPSQPDEALSASEWWLAQTRGLGLQGRPALFQSFPGLAQGQLAENERQTEAFTIYDGYVPEAGAQLDPRINGAVVSATRLERAAGCPYQYFLQYGLGISPLEERELDRDVWLDAAAQGLFLHEIYARFLTEDQTGGKKLNQDQLEQIRELGEMRLQELLRIIPPPSEGVFNRQLSELLRDLELFLRLELQDTSRRPVGLEVAFGSSRDAAATATDSQPVSIPLRPGERLLLRGRIDRIDRLDNETYEIVDYKTGSYRRADYSGSFQGGRLLQHGLYAQAAEQWLRRTQPDAKVTSSSYYFPTTRGGGERSRKPVTGQSRRLLAEVLSDLFDLFKAGSFVHSAKSDDCRFCDFAKACKGDVWEQSRLKMENPKNKVLDAYRRVKTHE